ncbi:hypothetical protein GCM10009785_08900 [Brooklawnia cerclae]
MIPNITRGTRVVGLMTYLVGDGRANEHTEQHLVAVGRKGRSVTRADSAGRGELPAPRGGCPCGGWDRLVLTRPTGRTAPRLAEKLTDNGSISKPISIDAHICAESLRNDACARKAVPSSTCRRNEE